MTSLTLPCTLCSGGEPQTEEIGRALAQTLLDNPSLPTFLALYGDLGVGKTALIRGFTSVIAPTARVKSPTFSLVHEYRGPQTSVFHFDLYRIDSEEDLYSIGFYDYPERPGFCLTEWSEKIEYALPEQRLRVEIVKDSDTDPDSRRITVTPIGF